MANVLNISSSLEPVVDTTGADIGSQTYTESAVDKNTGSIGGLYKNLTYDAAKAAKWAGVLKTEATAAAIVDASFKGGASDRTGTAPTKGQVLAVSYDSTLGTCDRVSVTIGTQVHARLKVGESCVIPVSGADDAGLAIANLKLHADAYTLDTHEATITVLMIGAS